MSAAAGGPARVVRTADPPDLALDVTDLAAAYLGGPALLAVGDAGRVRELTAGSLAAASRAFAADRPPFCPEVF
jgi:sterol carrier protein